MGRLTDPATAHHGRRRKISRASSLYNCRSALAAPSRSAQKLLMSLVHAAEGGEAKARINDKNAANFQELVRHDLAHIDQMGNATITSAGTSFSKRLACPEDPFRAQHGSVKTERRKIGQRWSNVQINTRESPLSWLAQRRDPATGVPLITREQFEAGERLRADYTAANIQPSISSNWDRLGMAVEGGALPGDCSCNGSRSMMARARVEKAIAGLPPEVAGVAIDVCCYLKGISLIEQERKWPARSAKVILYIALSHLARYYNEK